MKCPECDYPCDRESVDVGVGVIHSPWRCSKCGWDEDQAFPMSDDNWNDWLGEGPSPEAYV